jgi:serine/threonine protein kinase
LNVVETFDQSGQVIGDRYRIIAPLGQGGMGITYQAEDLTNNQPVAIKALSLRQLTDWKALELFEREAKVLATLNHPAIPKYLDYFQTDTSSDRRFYLVQELIAGQSLATLVQQGWHTNEAGVKQIAIQVLEILNYLHRLNPPVIHRDIKPQNIIRQSNGQLFLVDFGAVQEMYRHTLLKSGTFVGTYGYMPPEQFRGKAYFSSDLYGLGATLLFLLTHRVPADLPQTRMRIDVPNCVEISPEFADWLEGMLEPAVEDRFGSAQAAMIALRDGKRAIAPSLESVPFVHKQPKGSRIRLKKTNQHLQVHIPRQRFERVKLSLLALVGFLYIGLGLQALAREGFLISSAVMLPYIFGLVVLGVAYLTVFCGISPENFSTEESLRIYWPVEFIEIDRQNLWLELRKFGQKHLIWIPLSDVERVMFNTKTTLDMIQTANCAICITGQDYRFGFGLTTVEKEWLVAELSDFLKQVRS